MIDDSNVWKERLWNDLQETGRKLQALQVDGDRLEEVLVAIEALALLSGYITRKLVEAQKLSDELEGATMEVQAHGRVNLDYRLDFMNAHRIERAYDLENSVQRTLTLANLCNLLIHSFVFMPTLDGEPVRCTGFFLNSDRTKDIELYWIDWDDFVHFIDCVISDDVVSVQHDRVAGVIKKSRVPFEDEKPKISLNARP